ncbi:NAD(P)-dependent oxidoreductase [Nonomuraea rubra]|uniref:3-hydroxyisobutyrate dehydrogenase-like beta-hydroxyacid dehydrogenase n=1 Tax=Nonomuraea rubra TaxID=46180 RepID=A0A7X0P2K6_9ACTN|nr:NAD(P)-dependent oxidoreductase [Nonomuraea rubra]MBB6554088.1 3-hydroxyisobutyrate dehydrogenase-like beta-hydroxyacid dehydrogenase [Nonomuraea rubra]
MDTLRVAVLGHGEVGRVLAAGLAGKVRLRVYDPVCPEGGDLVARNADAVRGADLVIAVTTGADSLAACAESRPHLKRGALYADLSTGAPGDKRRVAELLEPAGVGVVDGAIMAPVPLRGLATPVLASGAEAGRFAVLAGGLGMSVTPIGGAPGDAAARKLLRSVLVKGLSALVIESQRAAEEAGLGEWFWGHLLETVTAADEEFVVRLLKGAGQHGVRRVHEMEAATRMLEALGVPDTMTRATTATLDEVTRTGIPPVPDPS